MHIIEQVVGRSGANSHLGETFIKKKRRSTSILLSTIGKNGCPPVAVFNEVDVPPDLTFGCCR